MKNGHEKQHFFRNLGAIGKLNICYCRIINIFWQIYAASVPKETILRDCSVYSYSGIRRIKRTLAVCQP